MSAMRSLLLLLLPLCPGPGPGLRSEAKVTRSCTETRQVLGARGYSLNLLPPALISGEHLQICPQEYTCCSSEIEQRLTWETESTLQSLVEENGSFLVHMLSARHKTFDETFREMLLSSEHSLALLFHRSYGRHLYAQHTLLFSGLFSRLRDYYEKSGGGLDDALADFWAQLLERIFPVLHPQYSFSSGYLFCLTRFATSAEESLKPFGDSPRRLRQQLTRALLAARAFVQGLKNGRDVVNEALKTSLTEDCKRAVMRLIGCPLCRGVPSLAPCRGFCLNVAHGCLGPQGLDPDWKSYLDSLLLLADKLLGPFSFEQAARAVGLRIQEALMYLQEHSVRVSSQVFKECGAPQIIQARTRRAPPLREDGLRLWSSGSLEEQPPTQKTMSNNLTRLVWELRERLGRVRGFWAGLPQSVCADSRMAADISQEAASCWTGAGRGRYLSRVVEDSETEHQDNPEFPGVTLAPDLAARKRRLLLRSATIRMKAAAEGRDLASEDSEGSSAGSGEGVHYADDWMAGAAAVPAPARPPRPPRREGAGSKGGGVVVRHNQGRSRTGGASLGFHFQPTLIISLSVLALLGPR
ncbi:glypican-2 [Sorex fumeus]|uniref:glypican-2 n=1 Tax=Sorex fumeus TaxID=62283 RepID=UPI0024ADBEF0|nr:glypican-2 [Sorex fumeus]